MALATFISTETTSPPKRFDRLAGRFDVVDEVVVIGDTAHDVRCAQSIGAVAIAVSNGLSSAAELKRSNPDILLDDLTDATAVMERFQTCRR